MGYDWLYWFTTLYWVIGSIDQFMNQYKAVNRTGTKKKVRRTSKILKMEQREPACTWNIFLFHILEGLRRAFVWIFWGGTCNLRHRIRIAGVCRLWIHVKWVFGRAKCGGQKSGLAVVGGAQWFDRGFVWGLLLSCGHLLQGGMAGEFLLVDFPMFVEL